MKVCPDCQAQYDDDVETCPNDGAELVAVKLPENPELREVIPVAPSEATAMIDLEALEQKRRERALARGEDPDARDQEPKQEHDPDATGTLDLEALEEKRRRCDEARARAAGEDDGAVPDAGGEHPPAAEGADEATRDERKHPDKTVVTRSPRRPARKEEKPRPPVLVLGVLGGGVLVAVAVAVGVFLVFRSVAPLTVTTVPPGARVVLDGKELGEAPVQARVKVGRHTLELFLDGYEPFKEIVEVPPGEGLPFMQPLKRLEERPGAEPLEDAGPDASPKPEPSDADRLVAECESLLEAGKLDAAFAKIKALVRLAPDDPRADALFDKLAQKRIEKSGDRRRGGPRRADPGERRALGQAACAEGEQALSAGDLSLAKVKLQTCIQLNPRLAKPHRVLARIYAREGNDDRTRYHLQRYLALGGKDPDYKVRRWLEEHPERR